VSRTLTGVSSASAAGTVSRSVSNPVSGDNEDRILTILDGRSPHFAYSTPADPVTTQEITVTTAAQFNAYAGPTPTTGTANGWRITIGASFSGNIQIGANDIDVVMSNSLTISGRLTITGGSSGVGGTYVERIRWTGGNVGTLYAQRVRDLLLDDFYCVATPATATGSADINNTIGGGWDGSGNPAFARVAIINSWMDVNDPNTAGDQMRWALVTPSSYVNYDLIIANTKLTSNQQNNRFQNVTRMLIVDSVFNPNGASVNGMRMHYECTNVWVKDSWSRLLFKMDAAGSESVNSAINVLFDNYDRYYNDLNYALHGSKANTGEIRNSTFYGQQALSYAPLTNGGGNSSVTWDGSTVPDYSTVGAIR
jgi:hypothetical protein